MGKIATMKIYSSDVWPTTVNCEDVVKPGCKKDTYTFCLWHFCTLSRRKGSGTTVDSSRTEPTSSPSDVRTSQLGKPTPNQLEMEKRVF